jgi:hypothetical protein
MMAIRIAGKIAAALAHSWVAAADIGSDRLPKPHLLLWVSSATIAT